MKNHQNKTYLEEQIALGKTSKDIADENRVSFKLVEIYLTKYNIPYTPKVRFGERAVS
jgi:hypothetical protein